MAKQRSSAVPQARPVTCVSLRAGADDLDAALAELDTLRAVRRLRADRGKARARYPAGLVGGFGFLGFGGLFGVLSPTTDLLLVRLGRSTQ